MRSLHDFSLLRRIMSVFSAIHGHSGGGVPLPLTTATSTISSSVSGLVAALSKWSVAHGQRDMPLIPDVRSIHIYDFDNTLFLSPLPNPKLWNSLTVGHLQQQEVFMNGGWWHDSKILAATGEGLEKEEARAWEGWWNEHIVTLVELSMAQKDTLCVLLTGRSVKGFSNIIQRMVKSKNLEFDMICLKPEVGPEGEKFQHTKHFKTTLLTRILDTYVHAEDLKIYEDRVGHVCAFEKFLEEYNSKIARTGRRPIAVDVVQVAALTHCLDPVVEVAEIQKLINDHNAHCRREHVPGFSPLHIKKHVFFTGYLLSPKFSQALLEAYPVPKSEDIRTLADSIMIAPRRANHSILHKAGGLGNQVEFEVYSIGVLQDRLWAALVRPVDPKARVYTEGPRPMIVLAHRKGTKPIDVNFIRKWQDVDEDKKFRFVATVGEKMLLRIESEEETARLEREIDGGRSGGGFHPHPYNGGGPSGGGGYGGHHQGDGYHVGNENHGRGGHHVRGGRRRNFGYDDRRPTGPRIRRQWD